MPMRGIPVPSRAEIPNRPRSVSVPYHPEEMHISSGSPVVRGLTSLPKYAAFAIPQNSPTSTTPVSILIRCNSYNHASAKMDSCRSGSTHVLRLLHHRLGKRGINDETSVIADHRPGLHLAHPQGQAWFAGRHKLCRPHLMKVGEHLGVCEWRDLDRYTLGPLGGSSNLRVALDQGGDARWFRGSANSSGSLQR